MVAAPGLVAVVGAGTMGSGIAQVAARAGHPVRLVDAAPAALERGLAAVRRDLEAQVTRGRMAREDAEAALDRIRPAEHVEEVAGADWVVEAIVEDRDAKRALVRALEAVVSADCVIASNTSSISITELAAGARHPGRVVGMHFFNPVPRMALVEVVDGLATDPAVAARVEELARAWGKTPVRCRSTPGFIVNRVARPLYGEAMRTLTEQATDAATLDAIVRECGAFPMGPCELMDLIGLDVNLAVTGSTFQALGWDRRYAPSLVQQELVRAGRLGRKSGQGFHRYGEGAPPAVPAAEPARPAPAELVAPAAAGLAEPLLARLAGAGVRVRREGEPGSPWRAGRARLLLTDGRTATRRAAEEGWSDLVLVDFCRDFARSPRLCAARSDTCSDEAWHDATGLLQAAGVAVSRVDDMAGLVVARILATLANEAADVVTQGIASPADVDTAMRLGTNWPEGPLAWCDRAGAVTVVALLDHLRAHTGEERYRVSPGLSRRRWSGGVFHG